MSVHISDAQRSPAAEPPPSSPPDKNMVWIAGGTFLMGSDEHYSEEAPAHRVMVSGFWIDRTAVTNAAFRRFVKATGYVTLAERVPDAALYPGAQPEHAGARLGRLHAAAGAGLAAVALCLVGLAGGC